MARKIHPNSLKNLKPPIQKGERRNPKGRPSLGCSVKEWMNAMQNYGRKRLVQIAKSDTAPSNKAAAAVAILQSREYPDMADYTPILRGRSLTKARKMGVDTTLIKKLKPTEWGISIELHDRSGPALDRIINHTDGKPTQTVRQTLDVPQGIQILTPLTGAPANEPQRPDPDR